MNKTTMILAVLLIEFVLMTACCMPGAQIDELNIEITQLRTEIKRLEAENTSLTQQIATLDMKLEEKETELAVIKLPAEVKLDVPFEPNLGNTCFSSSFAMVMRYWGKYVTVHDVLKIVGYPPFRGYEHPELIDWMGKNHELRLEYLPYSKVEDIKIFLSKGYPIVVHQTFSVTENTGHNRVVIGYSDSEGVFFVNDPSNLGPNYKISYKIFEALWKNITLYETGPENKAYLVIPLK